MAEFWELYSDYEKTRLFTDSSRKHYQKFLTSVEESLETDFLSITPQQATLFRRHLESGPLSATTRDERLRILKSIGNYLECVLPGYRSPFSSLAFFTETTFYTGTDIPTLAHVSELLSVAEKTGNVRGFLSVTLALRLCLSKSEIVAIRRGHFYKGSDEAIYLRVPAKKPRERILPVPADVIELINNLLPGFFLSTPETPLFAKQNGEKITGRTLNRAIIEIQEKEPVVTLQQIRTLGILLLLQDNKNASDVSLFAGIGDRWMFRYEQRLQEPVTAVTLPNIHICLEGDLEDGT